MNQDIFEIGQLIYTVRKLNSHTQVEFSKKLGVVQSTISKVEKGFFEDVPFSLVSNISKIFNVPIHQFQNGRLQLLDDTNLKNIIPEKYTLNGTICGSEVLSMLNEAQKNSEKDYFRKLGIKKQYFCIDDLKFNEKFLKDFNKYFSVQKTREYQVSSEGVQASI